MRRLLFPALIWTPLAIGVGVMGYAGFESDLMLLIYGHLWTLSSGVVYGVVSLMRLQAAWPAGVLVQSGVEYGVQWQKRHAKRGRFQIVTGKERRQPPQQPRG